MTEILVHVSAAEVWVALAQERRIMELHMEPASRRKVAGDVYKGRVQAVLPGMQAAFVDIGLERNGFLAADEVNPRLLGMETGPGTRRRIEEMLKEGQQVLVQVIREPFGEKGAGLTTALALPGHTAVLLPNRAHLGVSRRIQEEEERERLRQAVDAVRPQEMGVIVRTAAWGHAEEEVQEEVSSLVALWEGIKENAGSVEAPALLYQDLDLANQVLRDLFNEGVDRVVADSPEAYRLVQEFLQEHAPEFRNRVHWHEAREDLVEAYGLDVELQKALKPRVRLKSGGFLVFDHTEALTTVDVNSGRFVGKRSLAETVLQTNLEAAREIPRQLRLRNVGGIVIIDFIDMQRKQDRQQVLDSLAQSLEQDRTRTHLMGITRLGLVEMTRKRVRPSLRQVLQQPCNCCAGTGRLEHQVLVASRIKRTLGRVLQENSCRELVLEVHPSVAQFLEGEGQPYLEEIGAAAACAVSVRDSADLGLEHYRAKVPDHGGKVIASEGNEGGG